MIAGLIRRRSLAALLTLVLLTPALAGCALFGGAAAQTEVLLEEEPPGGQQTTVRDAPAEEAEFEAGREDKAGAPLPAADEASAPSGAAAGEPMVEAAPLVTAVALESEEAAKAASAAGEAGLAEAEGAVAPAPQQVSELKAGEIDDNEQWDDYLLYRRDFLERYSYPVHDVDVSGRHIINVRTPDGAPVLGVRVRVYAGQVLVSDTRTYATGQTLFFPNASSEARAADSFQVVVEKDGQSNEFTLNRSETNEWFVTLNVAGPTSQQRVRLDVLFLIDATGSMADEIEQLQSNILSISEQIKDFPAVVDTRFGMVTYRDRGDEYVTRVYDFTPDVRQFQADLSGVRADGGGDYPESLNEALHDALHGPEWRVEDTVSLVFLVADAPPHLDYPNDYDYAEEMVEAAHRGIKVHPIASSGLDPQGEYIFRQIAQYTLGHFIFLTYEQEQGDYARPDLSADQQDYSVEALDELVVRLIGDELDALFGE